MQVCQSLSTKKFYRGRGSHLLEMGRKYMTLILCWRVMMVILIIGNHSIIYVYLFSKGKSLSHCFLHQTIKLWIWFSWTGHGFMSFLDIVPSPSLKSCVFYSLVYSNYTVCHLQIWTVQKTAWSNRQEWRWTRGIFSRLRNIWFHSKVVIDLIYSSAVSIALINYIVTVSALQSR